MRSYIGEKLYECDYCGKVFSIGFNFNVYRRIYTGEKFYECFICGKVFSDYSFFRSYVKIYRGRSFLRRLCGRGFSEYLNVEEVW